MYFYFCAHANVAAISSILGKDLLKSITIAILGLSLFQILLLSLFSYTLPSV